MDDDRNILDVGVDVVGGRYGHLIDVVVAGVGWRLEVRRIDKTQVAARISGEEGCVCPTKDTKSERRGALRGDGGDVGAIFKDVDTGCV